MHTHRLRYTHSQHRSTLAEERRAEQIAMGDRCMGFWRGLSFKVQDECIEQVAVCCSVLQCVAAG